MAPELLIFPVPRHITWGSGVLAWPEAVTVAGITGAPVRRTAARELGGRPARRGEVPTVRFLPAEEAPADLARWAQEEEGYALVIDARGIQIWAAAPAGHLYGALTLRQLRAQFGAQLPHLRISDAPALRHRGAMLVFPQGHTAYRPAYMRHAVRELARWKINVLHLYLESYFDFPSLPGLAGPGAMTAVDARALDKLCQAYHIQLVPMLNLLGHCGEILATQRYHHLLDHGPDDDPRAVPGFSLCTCDPEVHALVDTILADIFSCFSAEIIHVGGDEVNLGDCPRCAARAAELGKPGLYLEYFRRIQEICMSQGRKMGLWGDILLHYYQDADPAARRLVVDSLAQGTVIYDWHYTGGSAGTAQFFVGEGLTTVVSSSTNLVYTASPWLAQAANQRLLFADAIAAGALGGMTTAWCNFTGLHEEQYNYLFASGATALWSGPEGENLAPGLTREAFERAYNLQRYGLRTDALTRFWHILGDATGPVLTPLAPLHGANVRKCLYHTDNVLTFWKHYSHLLRGEGLAHYREGIRRAREAWEEVEAAGIDSSDPYLSLHVGPLLMHEHLLRRYEMSEAVYLRYAEAGRVQFKEPTRFAALLHEAADLVLGHLADFSPVEEYLRAARRAFGLEQSSLLRLQATRRKIWELADFLRYLATAGRWLLAFVWLHDMFLERAHTNWWVDREHEWVTGPARFRRYSIEAGPWKAASASAERER